MKLSKHLVLFRYLLHQFGFEDFEKLREEFKEKMAGYTAMGHSQFAASLMGNPKPVTNSDLMRYDEEIRSYEEELIRHRNEPYLSFKYFQWFSLLFTEYFFDELAHRPDALLLALNAFKSSNDDFKDLDDYERSDLKKLAYWMATGSGKTLIMHVNFWQLTKYFSNWENIILITPNEGLSQQHYEEYRRSGIKAKLYSGSEESLKTQEGEVLIIEITKLTRDKEGEGVSVDVDYFSESRNLVFIDEGHKGQSSEEKAWKQLREHLTRGEDSFTVEYSATFGQIISNRSADLLNEYGKSIIFDYSYRYFYEDGYGKDFSVFNIQSADGYSEKQTQLLLTASLLGFYEQLALYEKHERELKAYNIEKPLWVFVGSKVVGKKPGKTEEAKAKKLTLDDQSTVSDVSLVLNYFNRVLSSPASLQKEIDKILSEQSGLLNSNGDDIFKNRFSFLKSHPPTAEKILKKVFNGAGTLEALQIKEAEGEIGIRTSVEKKYFGVVNIGDVPSFSKKLEEDTQGTVKVEDDNISKSLFHALGEHHSTVNILIGSKKFIEGWNSWRVSSMGLMNMGRGEGAQIIQLFGRGVRLKGKDFSLKREQENAVEFIRTMQTINIFGLNADYMSSFLTSIEKEVDHLQPYEITIQLNSEEKWKNKIFTFKAENRDEMKKHPVELEVKKSILRRIKIDLRPKIALASGGFNSEFADPASEYVASDNPLHQFGSFIDYGQLLVAANRIKYIRDYSNLVIHESDLRRIIVSDEYEILTVKDQFGLNEALTGKIQSIAESLIRDYIGKFYADKEKDFLTRNLTYDFLSKKKYPELFPSEEKIIIKIPESKVSQLAGLFDELQKFHERDVKEIPTIHFGRHLYSPLAAWGQGKEDIKTVPVKLNKYETQFINDLRSFLEEQAGKMKGREIFVLRNLSKRGLGFFVESSSFYPDFILWVADEKRQTIFFLDPKGILMMGNLQNDKTIFCTETINEISHSVSEKLKKERIETEVSLKAYILSHTSYSMLSDSWGVHYNKEDFVNNKVMFMDGKKEYLVKIFEGIFI